jgi:hypothetical protein
MYKLTPFYLPVTEANCVIRLSDNSYIPFNEANIDYQEYLKWVAEGNTPLPAEESL